MTRITLHYPTLEDAAFRFERRSADMDELRQHLLARMEQLRGGWMGDAADAFFFEMDESILPALRRLIVALQAGHDVSYRIMETMREAENNAAHLFK
ncbi:MAG TPA: WXG100 family type VII secretion target [Anaerolineaceae bacterium]|nr:WXG100 family type VII secretion target [Anaerolineaceae bacterium]HPN51583.1 WXG100 family type VII secretion target [Anaerolineaceae bacterium]